MAVAVGLWSLVLTPGKPETVVPQSDLKITNVALGEELADPTGRTTVKFTYNTLIAIESDDDDEGHEDTQEPLSTAVICSLTGGKIEQSIVDIVLEEDEEYLFEIVGKNTVHLTGNYIDQTPPDNVPFNDESDEDSEEGAYDLRDVSSDVEMDPAELGTDTSRFEEVDDLETSKSLKRPREVDAVEPGQAKLSKAEKKNKKLKTENGKAVDATGEAEKPAAEDKKEKKGKKEKKETSATGEKDKPTTKELAGGIKYTDTKVGTGPMAKKGNSISMRYIGKLQNGKIFDQNTKGKPFTFRLGKGEVIKGWEEGIVGMQVGGERRLVLPPAMAYGKKGTDGIPANSTLIFECKLVEIK